MSSTAAAMGVVDPEAEMLASGVETGDEWEQYKENVRPLKRGRNVQLLNRALRSHADPSLKKSLLETRRRLIEAIDEYTGDDSLQPWLDCIKWVQESFPSGGECSGLLVIYEQCVRTFWNDDRYKDDLRYLKVWLEYAENCADAEVIYRFLEANNIGQSHSIYYSSYALQLESKNKMKKADDIFNLGLARKAKPSEKLEAAYRKFLLRSTKKKGISEDESTDSNFPVRSFGTVLATGETRRPIAENSDPARRRVKLQRVDTNKPLAVYNDMKSGQSRRSENLKCNDNSWNTLGTQSDRNKENASAPTKWGSYKVPQNIRARAGSAAPSMHIEVFVDEECAEPQAVKIAKTRPPILQLREGDMRNIKKETELLKENPLRNFPLSCLR